MAVAADSRDQARAYLRLIAIAAAVGVPAALVAALFMAFVHEAEDWLWTDLPDWLGESSPPWYLVIGLPVVGAALVILARLLLPGDGGHPPLRGIGGGPTPWQYAPSVTLAALGTLVFGAVLGPEAPLIALGSAVGMVAVSLSRTKGNATAMLATAGSFAAISALFGGPLVAGVLLLEGGLAAGTALIPALVPGLVAAAVGYVLFVGFGSWAGLNETGLVIPGLPLYDGTHLLDLLLAIVVGAVTAVLIFVVRRIASRLERESKRSMVIFLLGGGLAVGLLAQIAGWLGADTQEVLFSGQSSVPAEIAENSAAVLFVLLVAKGLAYATSLGCGFRGGPVFPAIFLGVGVASFAVVWWDVSPTWAVAVGTAAGMAAGTQLVFAAILFSALLVGTNGTDTVPAAVLAAVSAWLITMAIHRRTEATPAAAPPLDPA
jgi:H+/Cl- antiporter ClcA